jgi:hypothetical protein
VKDLARRIDGLAEQASERPWEPMTPYGALVTQGRCANSTNGAEDRESYGGALIAESMGIADREFIAALVNAWPQIREALLELAIYREADETIRQEVADRGAESLRDEG